jgi:hypothetical protein
MITRVRAKGECCRPSAFENEKDKPFLPSSKPNAYGILHLLNNILPQQE